jgi:hypothetical protein
MSAVVSLEDSSGSSGSEVTHWAVMKGAPEVVRGFLRQVRGGGARGGGGGGGGGGAHSGGASNTGSSGGPRGDPQTHPECPQRRIHTSHTQAPVSSWLCT